MTPLPQLDNIPPPSSLLRFVSVNHFVNVTSKPNIAYSSAAVPLKNSGINLATAERIHGKIAVAANALIDVPCAIKI